MQAIIVLGLFGCSVLYLLYLTTEGIERLTPALQQGVSFSKHILALVTAVFGAHAVALLVSLPFFLYSYLTHTDTGTIVFSSLIDRPYFPLQVFVAFVLGFTTLRWFREGWAKFVWVLPLIQGVIAVAVFVSRFNPKEWGDYWTVFFDWGCSCSATLPQWTVMLPLYTSAAFSIGATIHSALTESRTRSTADVSRA